MRQPAALRRAVSALSTQHDELEALTKAVDLVPVFTGMGASYHACYPAVAALASNGKAALHVDAGELLHFRRPVVDARTIVVAVSQSGRSAEVVRLAEELRRTPSRPLLLAVCNGRDNPLARLADLALDTGVGEETGPSTMTLVASLAVLVGRHRRPGRRSRRFGHASCRDRSRAGGAGIRESSRRAGRTGGAPRRSPRGPSSNRCSRPRAWEGGGRGGRIAPQGGRRATGAVAEHGAVPTRSAGAGRRASGRCAARHRAGDRRPRPDIGG